MFKNGSTIDILAARQSSRGQRRTGGLMEECVLIDGDILMKLLSLPQMLIDVFLMEADIKKRMSTRVKST